MSFIPEKKIHQLAALIGSLSTIVIAIVVLGNMQWQTCKEAESNMKIMEAKYQIVKDSLLVLRNEITTMKTVAKAKATSKNKGRDR